MERIHRVLQRRQPDLAVVMENVHKPHNLSAIARSCDAAGAMSVHAIGMDPSLSLRQKAASGVGKWIDLYHHADLDAAFDACRARKMRMIAVSVDERSQDFREIDYTGPTGFVVGAELDGLSAQAQKRCDLIAHIPMFGMVESLNVSVATALVLFEARRQREASGRFEQSQLESDRRTALAFEWAQPVIARYCRRHDLPYPSLDAHGDVVDWTPPKASTSTDARDFNKDADNDEQI